MTNNLSKYYEVALLIKHDSSSDEITKILNKCKQIVINSGGGIIREETWGLRKMAYSIDGDNKAHYRWIGISSNNKTLAALKKEITLSEQIIRHAILRTPSISDESSKLAEQVVTDSDTEAKKDAEAKKDTTSSTTKDQKEKVVSEQKTVTQSK